MKLSTPILTISLIFVLASSAYAEIKCQEPLKQEVTGFDVSAKGELDGLRKILSAGGQVDIKPVVRNLLKEYPNADKVAAEYSLIQLTCEMIKNLNISDEEKFKQLQDLRRDILSEFRSASHAFNQQGYVIYVRKTSDRNYITKYMALAKLMTFKKCTRENDGVHMSGVVESPYLPILLFTPGFKVDNDVVVKELAVIDLAAIVKESNKLREAYDYMLIPKECVDFEWKFYLHIHDVGFGDNDYYYECVIDTIYNREVKYRLNWINRAQYDGIKSSYLGYKDACGRNDVITRGDMMGRFLTAALPDKFPPGDCTRHSIEGELVR